MTHCDNSLVQKYKSYRNNSPRLAGYTGTGSTAGHAQGLIGGLGREAGLMQGLSHWMRGAGGAVTHSHSLSHMHSSSSLVFLDIRYNPLFMFLGVFFCFFFLKATLTRPETEKRSFSSHAHRGRGDGVWPIREQSQTLAPPTVQIRRAERV